MSPSRPFSLTVPLSALVLAAGLLACSGGGSSPTSPSSGSSTATAELTAMPVDQSQVQWIGIFGQQDYPGGQSQYHNGLDLGAPYGTSYYAAGSGRVSTVEYNSGQGLPGTNYRIDIDVGNLTLDYHFEINGTVSDADRHAAILVSEGQTVTAGQHIGTLLSQADGAHVHFGTLLNGTAECPLDFFTSDVTAQFQALVASGIELRPANSNLCQ